MSRASWISSPNQLIEAVAVHADYGDADWVRLEPRTGGARQPGTALPGRHPLAETYLTPNDEGHRRVGEEVRPVFLAELARAGPRARPRPPPASSQLPRRPAPLRERLFPSSRAT